MSFKSREASCYSFDKFLLSVFSNLIFRDFHWLDVGHSECFSTFLTFVPLFFYFLFFSFYLLGDFLIFTFLVKFLFLLYILVPKSIFLFSRCSFLSDPVLISWLCKRMLNGHSGIILL